MTGILIPELVIYQTLENITKYIRDDLKANKADETKSFLYRLLGLDDDGNPMKMNRYNYFVQAKKIFNSVQNLNVNFGYNFEVAKIISFHIILPSEQPSSIPLGEDEGYQTETDEEGNTQLKFCQMFSSTYQIMITSDNSNEVNIVYHIYKSLLITLVPHLSLKGLLNPKLSGNDIVFQDDQMPMGIFHKVLNLSFDYELVVPQLLISGLVKTIYFEGTGIAPGMSSSGAIMTDEETDATGKTKDEYPYKEVEPGRNFVGTALDSSSDNLPSKIVEPGRQAPNDGREYPTQRIINGLIEEDNMLHDIRIAVTSNGTELLAGVAVQIKSEHYLYYAYTDSNGIATFPSIANEVYDLTLAKSGVNQGEFYGIRFDLPETHVQYSQVDKNIWDGMYSDTAPVLYVDIHDGGGA